MKEYVLCAFLPLTLALSYTALQWLRHGRNAAEPAYDEYSYSRPRAGAFAIVEVGRNYVIIDHPEGGAWGYGITQDLACTWGITMVEALGGWRYRIWTNRNPVNAARVLEAAYRFRTEPKVVEDGVVVLYKCPGYEILFQESERNLD